MYSIQEAFLRLQDWVNRDATHRDAVVDEVRGVWVLNESMNFIVSNLIRSGRNDDMNRARVLLKTAKLSKGKLDENSQYFELAKDYWHNSSLMAKSGACSIDCFEVKSDNINQIFNENYKPDITFQETPYYIEEKLVRIFKEGFEIDEATHTYYRKPKKVELKGYEKIDGTTTTDDVDFEFDDDLVDEIIIKAAEFFKLKNN
jgi:hypothetical protein